MVHYDFIREEQYFCSILMFAILKDTTVANDLFNIPLTSEENFEIYNETCILRDIWHRLGETTLLNKQKVNYERGKYLAEICELLQIDLDFVKNLPCYLSKGGYVNSPSNYNDINKFEDIKELRALFNMSQDLLIIFKDTLYFFEAKLESQSKRSQIRNYMILERLSNIDDNVWAASEKFRDIRKVKYFYIKRTDKKLNIEYEISDKFSVITWETIFNRILPVVNGINGVHLKENMEKLGINTIESI